MHIKKLAFSILSIFIIGFNMVAHSEGHEKPVIGILMNAGSDDSYSIYPWYAMRQDYANAVIQAGGIPIFIGHEPELIDDYTSILDGLVLTGADLQSPSQAYTTGITLNVKADEFPRAFVEFKYAKIAYEKNIPLLAICAGMQNLNVAFGGTLSKDIAKHHGSSINHRISDRTQTQHSITINADTKLYDITQVEKLDVNSNHREGIKTVADVFQVTALAEDGVIEAFEAPTKDFMIGVMWHPEFVLTNSEKKIWRAFIAASSKHKLTLKNQ